MRNFVVYIFTKYSSNIQITRRRRADMYRAWEYEKCLQEFNRKICREKTTWELKT